MKRNNSAFLGLAFSIIPTIYKGITEENLAATLLFFLFLLALPVFFILRYLKLTSWWSSISTGVLIGSVVMPNASQLFLILGIIFCLISWSIDNYRNKEFYQQTVISKIKAISFAPFIISPAIFAFLNTLSTKFAFWLGLAANLYDDLLVIIFLRTYLFALFVTFIAGSPIYYLLNQYNYINFLSLTTLGSFVGFSTALIMLIESANYNYFYLLFFSVLGSISGIGYWSIWRLEK